MSSFSPVPMTPAAEPLDPSKHVNYTLGMVLGVDDFNQEFAYLSNRDQWLARDLLGYGTVCGLEVGVGYDANKGKSIQVAPGVALNPHGQLIKVDPAQCAYLSAWLGDANTKKELKDRLKGASSIKVYLTLCYRDCPTDSVPVPGEPCRDETDALLVPSRIKDDFRLDLCFDAPDQTEENALRAFVAWLRKIDVKASGASTPSLVDFEKAISEAGKPENAGKKVMKDAPPAAWHISLDDLPEYLRVAFRVWTTEIRPLWRGEIADCVTPSAEECVLLAEVTLKLASAGEDAWALAGGSDDVVLDESRRPYLLHLRMLQEWLFNSAKVILKPAENVVEETAFGRPAAVGVSLDYARADHTHGTPPDPIPPHAADPKAHALKGDVHGFVGASVLAAIQKKPVKAESPLNGQVLGFVEDHWEPVNQAASAALSGDVQGDPAANKIASLQGKPVTAPNPANGQVLGFVKDHWEPVNQAVGSVTLGGDVVGSASANKIANLQSKPVAASAPARGQVLAFDGAQWIPFDLPKPQASGDFVTRPFAAGEFGIVAAGVCEYSPGSAQMLSTYSGLAVEQKPFSGQFGLVLSFTFPAYKPDFNGLDYIVKLTPWMTKGVPLTAWLEDFTDQGFRVIVSNPLGGSIKEIFGRLMVEVSQFEADNPEK